VEPSCAADGCPTPRVDRAFVVNGGELLPIACGRNGCPWCRRRNVQVTAARMAINETAADRPVTHAVLSTTRDWIDDARLREGWAQFARRVRREVNAEARYAWFREWTTGEAARSDGVRRTHYHSVWALGDDEQAEAVATISNEVWGRIASATSERAHGWQRVYDAGGLARYIAGLVGHHLKAGQAPPPGWRGRRFGTSRGFYAIAVDELDRQAREVVKDERLRHAIERELVDELDPPEGLPEWILDEHLTPLLEERLEEIRARPRPQLAKLAPGWSW
jgi:hypothetical protein